MATHENSINFRLVHVIQAKLLPSSNEDKHPKNSIFIKFEKGFNIISCCS